ncbi:ABC transporter permease [Xanthomonas prunicola]|uniref:MFS transporter n=1 Tax=Xanthomonas prunicola TaxID=2053930 RepID=UPI0021B28728|nr:MFS transporter [Xanthomonas prunicola]UXA57856.1 ABC transporter permease [Xanthomonas prunicola]
MQEVTSRPTKAWTGFLFLGFGSGLPYPLIGSTLGYWLSEKSLSIAVIGALAWTALPYSLKFLWARHLDQRRAPVVGSTMSHRQGWIVLSSVMVALSLLGLVLSVVTGSLPLIALSSIAAAFAGATLDASVDAFRIEQESVHQQPAKLLTAYQFGYRIALLLSDGLVFLLAARLSWQVAYALLLPLMLVPICGTLFLRSHPDSVLTPDRASAKKQGAPLVSLRPSTLQGWIAVVVFIGCYRLPDILLGPMINPFFYALGIGKNVVGSLHIWLGIPAAFLGILAAGTSLKRISLSTTILVGAALQALALLVLALLSTNEQSVELLWASVILQNLASSYTGIALVAYMSKLVTLGRAGEHYAWLTSFYSIFGRVLAGFSGLAVAYLTTRYGKSQGYGTFFIGICLTCMPALLVYSLIIRNNLKERPEP